MHSDKYVLALRAIKRSLKIDASNPDLHIAIVKFLIQCMWIPMSLYLLTHFSVCTDKTANVHPVTKQVVDEEIGESVLKGASLDSIVQSFRSNAKSIPQAIAAAKVMLLVDGKQVAKAADLVLSVSVQSSSLQVTKSHTIPVFSYNFPNRRVSMLSIS
jgi:hypothetical protein